MSTDKGTFKYEYNDKGLRISKSGPSGKITYSWDGDKLVAEFKEGIGLKATYLYGVGGQIHRKDALTGKVHYYFYNGHGDVTALADGTGKISTVYDYNAYGEVNIRGENIENPFRYFGQYYDEETGSYYLRARYYDPSLMRFTNEDTYQGESEDPLSLNKYLYCIGNPVSYVDESGQSPTHKKIDGGGGNTSTNPATSGEAGTAGGTAKPPVTPPKPPTPPTNQSSSTSSATSATAAPALTQVLNKLGEVVTDVSAEANMMINAATADPNAVLTDFLTGGLIKAGTNVLVKVAKVVGNVAKIGDEFGKAGKLVVNPGTKVDWSLQTLHGAERMSERNVTQAMVDSWVKNGKALEQAGGKKHLFFTPEGAAVVGSDGYLVTVIPKAMYDDAYKALSISLFGK